MSLFFQIATIFFFIYQLAIYTNFLHPEGFQKQTKKKIQAFSPQKKNIHFFWFLLQLNSNCFFFVVGFADFIALVFNPSDNFNIGTTDYPTLFE